MILLAPTYFTDLQNRTVVVTGASAGVGRAVARRFARQGARVALIARESEGLNEAKAEIEASGGRAVALAADMADAEAVFAAAQECERTLGPIDIWVNNAMSTVFSPVADLSPEEVRRVTEVTYLGYVHGTMAALKHMRPRDRGVIVQIGSSLAYRGIPLQAPYCAAKHAIRGFTDSLRTELLHDGSNVAITMVHLPAINTPQFDWARTHRGRKPRPVAPVYRPAVAARAIVHAALHPQREYWLGLSSALLILGNMLVPGLLDRYLGRSAFEGQHTDEPVSGDRRDNLFASVSGLHRTEGSFGGEAKAHGTAFPAPSTRVAAVLGGCLVSALVGLAAGRLMHENGRRSRPGR